MRVLVAPDKFRGTLSARQAAEAIATGWMRERPHDRVDLVPMADGGEGTMDALVDALGGSVTPVTVAGPLATPSGPRSGSYRRSKGSSASWRWRGPRGWRC